MHTVHVKESDGIKFFEVTTTKLSSHKFFMKSIFSQSFINVLCWKFKHAPLRMSDFCNIYPRFQDFMAACTRFPWVCGVGILSCYMLDLIATVNGF